MITAFIVISAIILGLAFGIAYLVKPGFRQRVERPKHLFAEQLREYDESSRPDSERETDGMR